MSSPDGLPTRIANRYRIDERIGAGAMGAVWRGTDELLNRTVAVKELLAVPVPDGEAGGDALEESRQRILREGRIGARLQHPHVISMFDVVLHDDRPWLVMEYLPSKSLAAVLAEKGPMEPREAAEVGRQVADGLAAAHAAGVVHRDVKPGNVLLGEDGRVKITDFGVSRAVDDVQLTRTGMIAGTPAFLAPEVARGQDPTAASDAFALGATLYAAVEGEPPFGLDDNAYALLHKVATGVVRPPEHAGPLTALLMRLLSIEPTHRPTVSQARDALAAIADGVPVPPIAGQGTAVFAAPVLPERPRADRRPAAARRPAASGAREWWSKPPAAAAARPARGAGGRPPGSRSRCCRAARPTPTRPSRPCRRPRPPRARRRARPSGRRRLRRRVATPTPTTSAPAPATDPVGFVQQYYGLLPGDTGSAFAMLGPAAQQQSGGRAGFDAFYARMSEVRFENARASGDDSVAGTVVFVQRGGATTTEPYRFRVATDSDGRTLIQSFNRG